jgi:hypothetical protein
MTDTPDLNDDQGLNVDLAVTVTLNGQQITTQQLKSTVATFADDLDALAEEIRRDVDAAIEARQA